MAHILRKSIINVQNLKMFIGKFSKLDAKNVAAGLTLN